LQSTDADPDPLEEHTLESRIAFEGQFLRVFVDRVRCPDGHIAPREYLRHPGAVMMIPLLDDGRIVLERQYRYPLRRSFIEFPAGKIDAGESLLGCAQRELAEETGYRASTWTYFGGFHNAIGYCDEQIHVYLAEGLSRGDAVTDDGEVLEVFTATPSQLLGWIADGAVTDVKTMIGAYWLDQHLRGERPTTVSPDSA
jgi:ADP-ribose pyrophosphatase